MQLLQVIYRLTLLPVMAVIIGFSGNPHHEKRTVNSTYSTDTSAEFESLGTAPIWYALTAEYPSVNSTQQEYSGAGESTLTLQESFSFHQYLKDYFDHPSFYKCDQRRLLFQYLYPFHFFF